MTKTGRLADVDRVLAPLGLFLILAVARLCAPAYSGSRSATGRISGFVARRAIDAVAIVGWLIDRLPLSAATFPSTPGARVGRPGGWRAGSLRPL